MFLVCFFSFLLVILHAFFFFFNGGTVGLAADAIVM